MSEQTVSNKIGNLVGTTKRRLLDRLKDGIPLEDAVALFIAELRLALEQIITESKSPPVAGEGVN